MPTVFLPYQMRFVIAHLTKFGDLYEDAGVPEWHTLASAAACLEHLLQGDNPADIDTVAARLKAFDITTLGKSRRDQALAAAVLIAWTIIDGHRLGLISIQPEIPRPPRRPAWIGIDLGTSDRTVFGGCSHA